VIPITIHSSSKLGTQQPYDHAGVQLQPAAAPPATAQGPEGGAVDAFCIPQAILVKQMRTLPGGWPTCSAANNSSAADTAGSGASTGRCRQQGAQSHSTAGAATCSWAAASSVGTQPCQVKAAGGPDLQAPAESTPPSAPNYGLREQDRRHFKQSVLASAVCCSSWCSRQSATRHHLCYLQLGSAGWAPPAALASAMATVLARC